MPKKKQYPRERTDKTGLARPFLARFSKSFGLRTIKFGKEFEDGIYASIGTTFLSSEKPYFYLWMIIGPKGPFSFSRVRK